MSQGCFAQHPLEAGKENILTVDLLLLHQSRGAFGHAVANLRHPVTKSLQGGGHANLLNQNRSLTLISELLVGRDAAGAGEAGLGLAKNRHRCVLPKKTLNSFKDVCTENGSSQGQKLAFTGLFVPSLLNSVMKRVREALVGRDAAGAGEAGLGLAETDIEACSRGTT